MATTLATSSRATILTQSMFLPLIRNDSGLGIVVWLEAVVAA
jgi:hypothetical protein